MRTAQICPTCATYTNAVCVIYDGIYLSTLNIAPLTPLEEIIEQIDAVMATLQPDLGFTPEDVANKSTNIVTDQASNIKYPSVKAVYDWCVATFQPLLGFTPENIANKSTNVVTDQASNTKYPSVKAVYDWGVATFQPLLGFTPENVANKSTDNTLGGLTPSNTLYPSQKAVKDYVDNQPGFPYKVCTLNINFDGSNYTIEDTYEDTIGVTIATVSTQRFTLTSTGNFTLGKVVVIPMIITGQPGKTGTLDWVFSPTVNTITIRVADISTGGLATPTTKGTGIKWILEVRVYP